MEYHVRHVKVRPEMAGLWDGPAWRQAEALVVGCFRPESSDHRPQVQAKLLFDAPAVLRLDHAVAAQLGREIPCVADWDSVPFRRVGPRS